MSKFEEMNSTFLELQKLVSTPGALSMKTGILKVNCKFIFPTTMFHPGPKYFPISPEETAATLEPTPTEETTMMTTN